MQFSKSQLLAINHTYGRCQVVAGPGSGKTAVLIARTIRLIKAGFNPERIIIFTFTNKACAEIKRRLRDGLGYLPKVTVTTFHSFAYLFFREMYKDKGKSKLRPLIKEEQKDLVSKFIKANNYPFKNKQVIRAFSGIRNEFTVFLTEIERLRIADLYFQYEKFMQDNYYMDFDEMVFRLVEEMKANEDLMLSFANSYDFIMVDECQDINNIQFELLMILESAKHNLFMVGDPDQCIYGWRGSKMRLIKAFIEMYGAQRIDLGENYRSDKYIVDDSGYMIGLNNDRVDLKLKAMLPAVNPVVFNDYMTPEDEAYSIADEVIKLHKAGYNYYDIIILIRENSDADSFEIAFKKKMIPLSKDVISFFDRKEIRTIYNYYNLIINHDDDLAYEYVSDKPAKGIQIKKVTELAAKEHISLFEASKRVSSAKTNEFARMIEDLSAKMEIMKPKEFFDYLLAVTHVAEYKDFNTQKQQQNIMTFKELLGDISGTNYKQATKDYLTDVVFTKVVTNDESGSVRIMTIHQAKGLEAKVVFMAAMTNKYGIYDFNEEERRINYVGATRAKEKLYCSYYSFFNSESLYSLKPTFYYNELRYAQKHLNASSNVATNKKEGN